MKRVFAFIGFTVAITLIILNIIPYNFAGLVLSIAVVLFGASLLIPFLREGRVVCVVFGSVIFACVMFMLVTSSSVMPAKALDRKTASATLQLVDIPEYSEESDSYTYTAKTTSIHLPNAPQNIKLRIKSDEKIGADYYDCVTADLFFYSLNDNPFDSYGLYGNGIYISAKLNAVTRVQAIENKPVNYYLIELREYIHSILLDSFFDDTAGLSIALLTGCKSYLSVKIQNDFKICGLSHYMAVSGFHISLVSLGAYYVLKRLKVPTLLNTFLSMAIMLVYVGVADFSKSSLRACIMLSVVLFARLVSSKADTLNSLGLAVLLLCFNPFAVTDAGAVLTTCAVLGIMVIYRNVMKCLRMKNAVIAYICKGVILSASILLALIPPLYLFFGSVSVLGVLLNLLIEPLLTMLIIAVILFCFVYGIPYVTAFQVSVINLLSDLILNIIHFTAKHFSFLFLNISGEIFGASICAVFLLAGAMLLVKKRISIKGLAVFICIVTILSSLLFSYQQNSTVNVYISQYGAVAVYDKSAAVVIGLDNRYDKYFADSISKNRETVFIDSALYSSKAFTQSYLVSDKITVSRNNEMININALDKDFKISDSCVIIGDRYFSRTLNADFYGTEPTQISFTENSQLVVRRGTDG